MEFKKVKGDFKELNEKGEGLIVFATLNVIDSDEDVTLNGAFGEQIAPIIPAHDWQQVPIGKAKIREDGDSAVAEIKLNLKTDLGRNWYESLKFDMENFPPAKQEYSYGFDVLKESRGEFEGRQVRFLEKMKVHEISPVLLGAGIGTGTLGLKENGKEKSTLEEDIQLVKEYAENLIKRVGSLKQLREKDGRDISKERIKDLLEIEELLKELQHLCETPKDDEVAKVVSQFQELETVIFDMKKDLI